MIDVNLEKTILASLLIDEKNNIDTALMILKKDHFTMGNHEKLFRTICALSQNNEEVTCVMAANHSGIEYEVISAMMEVSTVSNVEAHCNKLKELYNIRKITGIADKIKTMAFGNDSYHNIIGMIDKAMLDIDIVDKSYVVEHVKDQVGATFESLEGNNKDNSPIYTGFSKLDTIVGGMYQGEYVVLGARPGMGKTAFALNTMMSVSKAGHKVLMFSIEMRPVQLIKRYLSSEGLVNGNKIRNCNLQTDDYEKLQRAAEVIYGSNIYVNSSKKNTVYDIRSIARRHLRDHPETRLIVLDYLQYIRDTDGHRGDKRLANEEKSIVLCDLAAELNVTVLALAQLSRNCENRADKRPILSDLKESGQIEQDAHIIMFLYRGYKYGDSRKVKSGDQWVDEEYQEDDVDVIVSKNREGDVGDVQMKFKGEYSSFYDIDNYRDPFDR